MILNRFQLVRIMTATHSIQRQEDFDRHFRPDGTQKKVPEETPPDWIFQAAGIVNKPKSSNEQTIHKSVDRAVQSRHS